MAEEKTKLKKYWAEQAVSLALQGRWAEAITANQNILSLFPSDAEAYNRLGKAYTELGKYAEAKDSYEHALQIDPGNTIAEKNLRRLAALMAAEAVEAPPPPPGQEYLQPHLFIEEMGKTGITTLINPAPMAIRARQSTGDPVNLRIENTSLIVETLRGDRLGEVEPKLAQRLIGFMKAGNRYAAAISSLDNSIRIVIRETYQHPSQIGRVSFPGKASETFRPYVKDSVLKIESEDEDEEGFDEAEMAGAGEVIGDEVPEEVEPLEDDLVGTVDDK